jgi:aspartate/methionine/tyrosine aminotransferase
MVTPALRTNSVKEYYFSKKMAEIDRLNKAGKQIINLGIGNPDMPPAPEVLAELNKSSAESSNHGYAGYKGIPELREAFAQWYARYFDAKLNPDREILPLIGSKEGIMHISMAFLNPGDEVLVPNPGYPVYRSVAAIIGANITEFELTAENNWYPDFDALEKRDLSKVKLMWVNYPNMPTGQAASKALFERLTAFGKKHQILIVNDNPYSFILHEKSLSILSVKGAKDNALELNSLSKSHNMAGFRIGMLAGSAEAVQNVLKIKSNSDSGMYIPLQLAAIKALQAEKQWYESLNREYRKRRISAEKIFHRLDVRFDKKQNGMFLWGRIPVSYKNAEVFSEKILNNYCLFITPGSIFGSAGNKFLRLSLCSSPEKLRTSLNRIQSIHSSI